MQVQCPNCSQLLNAPDNLAGQVYDCPACSKLMRLPEAAGGMAVRAVGAAGGAGTPASGAVKSVSRSVKGFGDEAPVRRPASTPGIGKAPEKPCPHCGKTILAAALQCHHCQTWLSGPIAGQSEAFPKSGAGFAGPAESTGDGKKALILGIIGFACCSLCAPIAIGYGIKAMKSDADRPMGIAGLILGILGVLEMLVILLLWATGALIHFMPHPR